MSSVGTMNFEDLQPGVLLSGIVADQVVTVVAATPMADAVSVFYTTPNGGTGQEIVNVGDLNHLHVVAPQDSAPKFDADPEEFRLAAEALRIKDAALYDPMTAVYSSNIDPLPHQIRAVYEDMLPKVPLRFLLADDPGAGKTIMAGLYIKEMLLRSAAERVVIVCPGGLAEQWRDELSGKFSLDFEVFDASMVTASSTGNPFRDHGRLICRMDQIARNDDFMAMMGEVTWDIAIVDEAHRMSAHFKSWKEDIDRTGRFRLGETLSRTAENLLLMTATPHSGKEQDFQLFMSLLDKDRFAGRYDPKLHQKTDTKGLMRRMVKEDLLTFDGKPLFPERHAYTMAYELSPEEQGLYDDVTAYVRSGMNAAQKIAKSESRRGNSIGFALTILQRRLASSPEAILRSLERRRNRLSDVLEQVQHGVRLEQALQNGGTSGPETDEDTYEDIWDDVSEDKQGEAENVIEDVVDSATAARSKAELISEINELGGLVEKAKRVRASGADAKWVQLSQILNDHILDSGTSDLPHKLIVFTEHKDTLHYLVERISTLLGRSEAVVTIHGGMGRDERKRQQERFVNDPQARILVATDAAGEGLNLQRADLMVNYDLPWNPNRIEQRFGRIHRIGQKRTCFLWNLVAKNTREGDVYLKLLGKIETMGKAYNGNLFNVLGSGKAFDGRPLKDLMIESILYGDRPDVQAKLDETIDSGVSAGLDDLVEERSVHPEMYPTLNVRQVREQMEQARERKLQPGYIAAFFLSAFAKLGGAARGRERGRWELPHVPQQIRHEAARLNRHAPVANAYERVTFDSGYVHIGAKSPDALLVAPGSPLLDAVVELIIQRYGSTLERGTVFVDSTDTQPDRATLMVAAEQTITDRRDATVSRHFDYLQMDENQKPAFSAAPPYLDYTPLKTDERDKAAAILTQPWIARCDARSLQGFVYLQGTKPRLEEIAARKGEENKHVLSQVTSRLSKESEFWYGQYNKLLEAERNGQRQKLTAAAAYKRAEDYDARLKRRCAELNEEVRLRAKPAVIRGMALVVPERLLLDAEEANHARLFAKDTAEVDRRAVAKTIAAERALGRMPTEMPHNNKGYDIRSVDASGRKYFIEVKGRIRGSERTFTVSRDEVVYAQTQGTRHRLSLVVVSTDGDPAHDEIRYVKSAFDHLDVQRSTASFNERLADYWDRGADPFVDRHA